jgi:hypothetical protein
MKALGCGMWMNVATRQEGNCRFFSGAFPKFKEAGEHTLGKTLGPLSITALGIGCIIGQRHARVRSIRGQLRGANRWPRDRRIAGQCGQYSF